jgi:hypothetical protein
MKKDFQIGYKESLNKKIDEYENGSFFNLNNRLFYKRKNILDKKYIVKKIISDIDKEIVENCCKSVPAFQTQPELHRKYKNIPHWSYLIEEINLDIEKYILNINSEKKITSLNCQSCWANVSTPESNYVYHNHTTNLTVVYFLKNPSKIYGTLIYFDDNEIILPGEENSLIIFNPKIIHCVVSPPPQVSSLNPRYSIVFDYTFNYE